MGVNHLTRDANIASGTSQSAKELPGQAADSRLHTNVPGGPLPLQVNDSNNVPRAKGVQSYTHEALKPKTSAAQPMHGGARLGTKTGNSAAKQSGKPLPTGNFGRKISGTSYN